MNFTQANINTFNDKQRTDFLTQIGAFPGVEDLSNPHDRQPDKTVLHSGNTARIHINGVAGKEKTQTINAIKYCLEVVGKANNLTLPGNKIDIYVDKTETFSLGYYYRNTAGNMKAAMALGKTAFGRKGA